MGLFGDLFSFDFKPEKAYRKELDTINGFKEEVAVLSDEQIREEIAKFKVDLAGLDDKDLFARLDEIRPRVFALTREAAKRSMGQFHYDVQLMGGIALAEGKIAEMKTGEGKTLTATLPLVLYSLAGKGTHIVTVNDYLSRWQASQMGPIYHFLGLSVAAIQHEASFLYDPTYKPEAEEVAALEGSVEGLVLDVKHMRSVPRRQAYAADITYGTNNEYGFDYLRDNMVQDWAQMVQRDLFFVVVDEVDSILIDEARTPLIISAPDKDPTEKYYQFAKIVEQLQSDVHYVIDEKRKVSTLTDEGISKIEEVLHIQNIYDTSTGVTTLHHIEQALRARANYLKDRDYVVRNDEVVIVDEFTGRLMFGRRYSEGLHQAIEAKEGVKIQQESKTLATITFQNLFRLYSRLSGMTGTAKTEEEEFFKIYKLGIVQVPTNKPMVRNDRSDVVYKTEKAKFTAIAKDVKERNKKGQPVLIGTVSIAKNEELAEELKREGVPFEILNAKNHEREAHIVAQAGRFGAVTLATNIAGRGVDILLGGNPIDPEEAKAVREAGGLAVIGTERHESRRIDNQLRGRSGRQGDPGESLFYVSMDDDLMRLFGGDKLKNMMERLGLPDDQPLEASLVSRSIESAQKKIEGLNFDTRKNVLEFDDVMNHQRVIIYKRRRKYLGESQAELRAKGAGDSELAESAESTAYNLQLTTGNISSEILDMLRKEIENVVTFAFSSTETHEEAFKHIFETLSGMMPVTDSLKKRVAEETENAANREFAVVDTLTREVEKLHAAKEQEMGVETYSQVQRYVALQSLDQLWMEHLDTMDHLRDSVRLRGYGQRDPLLEYKREGYQLFQRLLQEIDKQITYSVLRVSLQPQQPQPAPVQSNWVTNRSDVFPSSPSGRGGKYI
nr:preprotein translocase subunit SecA [Candidatus Doudnabacteria bacterium]